jgi:plastocyanin
MLAPARADISRNPHRGSVDARMDGAAAVRTLSRVSEGGTVSIKSFLVLGAAAAAIAVPSASAAGAATITISHQMKGCHMWQLGSGKPNANLTITLKAGTALRFVNNDIMPHELIQSAGPKLTLVRPNMNRLSAVATTTFTRKGSYRFTTKPGEDYKMFTGHKTIGEDYALHLTVHVK